MSDTPTYKGRYTMVPRDPDAHPTTAHAHDDIPGTHPDSLKAGHEPNFFNAKGVVFIPIGVTIATIMTYGLVTLLFSFFKPGEPVTEGANPMAAANNSADYNERVARISSQNPEAPVKQPRLEWMRKVDNRPGEPVFLRSFRMSDTGNSPEIYPEYLRAQNFIDWNTGEKPLVQYKWLDKDKGVARIPVNEAMKILVTSKKLPAKHVHLADTNAGRSKLSNGGQAAAPSPVAVEHDHDHDHKHEDKPKTEEPKKDSKEPE